MKSSFSGRLESVWERIEKACLLAGRKKEEITLVIVTKHISWEQLQEAYACGCRDFGENRVDRALEKIDKSEALEQIHWHFIGKLQTKKIPKVIGHFHLIHSIDEDILLRKLSEASLKQGKVTSILLEVNASMEASKAGLSPSIWLEKIPLLLSLKGVEIKGLMTMAPLSQDEKIIRSCFAKVKQLQDNLQKSLHSKEILPFLSMGMSNDFEWAIQEGATHIRIGSALFSE